MRLRTKAAWSLWPCSVSPCVRRERGGADRHDRQHRRQRHGCAGRRPSWRDGDGRAQTTGTSYEAVVGADGRFSILNVRVGPYTISAAMIGFKEQRQENVDVALGQERRSSSSCRSRR